MALLQYQYEPLADNHIRVLHLDPNLLGILSGKIVHIPLPKRLSLETYNTLSYCWGAETDTHALLISSRELSVRGNLKLALTRLSRQEHKRPIWIDAICINQNDDKEKLKQIQLMSKIYQRAAKVIIWLGEEIQETAATVAELRLLTKTLQSLNQATIHDSKGKLDPAILRGVGDLLTRPWYSRLWTLQEAVLAKNRVFLCGSYTIKWATLKEIAILFLKLDLCAQCRVGGMRPEFCDGFTELANIDACKSTHGINTIPNLLRTCRQRQCFDPKDRFYAILGLLPSMFRKDWVFNNDDTIEDLYIPFAAIMNDVFGMVFSLCETEVRRASLPSWCPDFHERSKADVLANWDDYSAGFRIHTPCNPVWDAQTPHEIRLKGIRADCVVDIIPGEWAKLTGDQNHNRDLLAGNCAWLDEFFEKSHQSVSKKRGDTKQKQCRLVEDEAMEDLWRAITGNRTCKKSNPMLLVQNLSELQAVLSGSKTDYAPEFVKQLKEIGEICIGRKAFVSSSGMIGLGPAKLEIGDAIWLVKGVKVPFMLRDSRLDGRLQLVGEAYVHGLMYGEGLKQQNKFLEIVLL